MCTFSEMLTDYILSGHAYLHCHTPEKTRFVAEVSEAAKAIERAVYVWNSATGWRTADGRAARNASGAELPIVPQMTVAQITEMQDSAIFILKDYGHYCNVKTFNWAPEAIAWLGELRDVFANSGRTVIFAGVDFDIPPALAHDITSIEFALPADDAIETAVRDIGAEHLVKPDLPAIVSSCRGMTQQQIEDRTALALRRAKKLDRKAAQIILSEKAEVIKRTGLLEYRTAPEGGLDLIGGWENVKRHVQLDKPCFTDKAREFGIEFPRGLLLVGISGGGKTQMSLCIASYLGLPLIQLDVGSLMSKWVGESERNMRDAIRLLEGIGSCVLQLDEIEKGFAGVGTEHDSGASARSFGIFLKWLSDRTCPVYVVATANNIASLPVEFTRKGRFDEIYGVYLPTATERADIFAIHLRLRKQNPGEFELTTLSKATEGYTGADIKEVVQTALKRAYAKCDKGNPRLRTEDLLEACDDVRPLSKTDPESVTSVTRWLDAHAKPASDRAADAALRGTGKRRVSI